MSAPATCRTRSVEECAAVLNLSKAVVRRLLVSGELPGRKFGNKWRVLDTVLDEYLENMIGKRGMA